MFIDQNKKYCNYNLYAICDTYDFPIEDKSKIYKYDNNEHYYYVWAESLKKFQVKNFIYLQEDFILYNKVNEVKIDQLTEKLNNLKDYSFIRLIKSGNLNNNKIDENLYDIESSNDDIFSMQPTIWKTEDYIKIMENVKEKKWLETSNYRKYMMDKNIKGLYYYENEHKRGQAHYDSNIYPYIATALVKSKWNISEYINELSPLIFKYNIDIQKRGVF